MDKDLKPCPFCGSDAIVMRNGDISCGADVYGRHAYCPLLGSSVRRELWNTRATDCPAVDILSLRTEVIKYLFDGDERPVDEYDTGKLDGITGAIDYLHSRNLIRGVKVGVSE